MEGRTLQEIVTLQFGQRDAALNVNMAQEAATQSAELTIPSAAMHAETVTNPAL